LVRASVPLSDFAVKWLPCGCQKLHPTVFGHLETKPKVKELKKNYLFLCCCPYSDSVGWDHAVRIMAEPKN
jgi:hypothetical protein